MDKYSSMMNSRKLNRVNTSALVKTAGLSEESSRPAGDARVSMQDRRKMSDRRRASSMTV
ncbi:alkaline phosphatase [Novimethylophilus kurashikiensis]|uniref:Alkaline phosphatase n=1 Tax=Novimethylophilus kurashikiensis TaxID=1825523 RepID=A0A2R5FA91_9PROT|nr:hypothetical protein [Novimethylophilus kurashikiensis]GBG15152.1 alkaline phosphatase [Novimethylophilus kurashikiensis]